MKFYHRFLLFFAMAFILGQLIKNPVESAIINSDIFNRIPYDILYLIVLSLPNMIFYFFVGFFLSMIMKDNLIVWITVYCLLEFLWIFTFFRPIFFKSSLFGYLLILFPKAIIPLSVILGAFCMQRLWGHL